MADPQKTSSSTETRPSLDENISVSDFQDFYWLKSELQAFCRIKGIDASGGKMEIAERISYFLATGSTGEISISRSRKPVSRFDWAGAVLTPKTVITDNYRNTRNVRNFFHAQIGDLFRITVSFMAWMKENSGKTLGDAVEEWKRQHDAVMRIKPKKEIAPQFEYNRYVRAFMADNPDRTRKEAVACWMVKKSRRGSREYDREDLLFLRDPA